MASDDQRLANEARKRFAEMDPLAAYTLAKPAGKRPDPRLATMALDSLIQRHGVSDEAELLRRMYT